MNIIDPVHMDMLIKLSVALLFGTAIGLERFIARKPAGIRTYSLVSMGAALFVIISEIIGARYGAQGSFEPLRMASQIVVGVGFLGAGMIMVQNSRLVGLTSASGLWVAAGIGVAAGFGLYGLAAIAAVLTLTIFTVFWFLEQKVRKIEDGFANE